MLVWFIEQGDFALWFIEKYYIWSAYLLLIYTVDEANLCPAAVCGGVGDFTVRCYYYWKSTLGGMESKVQQTLQNSTRGKFSVWIASNWNSKSLELKWSFKYTVVLLTNCFIVVR